jgi:GTP-dependent phosphoenolpyruvate carboxykinase
VTLKHPPLFAGTTIVVTAFDNAKNEFNISIENLTQAGKQMMDQENNRNNLLLALEQKGYAVHILSTTTLTETRVADALPTNQGDGRQREEEREGQGDGGKRGRENQA